MDEEGDEEDVVVVVVVEKRVRARRRGSQAARRARLAGRRLFTNPRDTESPMTRQAGASTSVLFGFGGGGRQMRAARVPFRPGSAVAAGTSTAAAAIRTAHISRGSGCATRDR